MPEIEGIQHRRTHCHLVGNDSAFQTRKPARNLRGRQAAGKGKVTIRRGRYPSRMSGTSGARRICALPLVGRRWLRCACAIEADDEQRHGQSTAGQRQTAAGQPSAKPFARPRQAAVDGLARTAEPLGDFLLGVSLQIMEDDGDAVAVRQPGDLLVE